MAMYAGGGATDIFKITLQYKNAEGENAWATVAEESAVKGEWVQLLNPNFIIPLSSTDWLLYVELAENSDFYIDQAFGAVAGKTSVAPRSAAKNGMPSFVNVKARTLTVTAEGKSNIRVKVVNLKGRTVASFKSKGNASFSLRKIPAGSYVVEAVKDGRKTTTAITLK